MMQKDSSFRKTDLHIHTAASVCYSNPLVKSDDIIQAALAAELQVIGVTDHNSVAGIEEIREAASNRLYVFPGVEITTRNGHFLALFEINTGIIELERFLDYAGIDKCGRGDAHSVSPDETEVLLKKIKEHGGVSIAAHIDRWPSGLMETKTSRRDKKKIHESEYLDALEITIPANRLAWNEGQVRDFPLRRACVQGSDAHKPDEIGRRPVYIKMAKPGLAAMLNSIRNYREDILFPDDSTG